MLRKAIAMGIGMLLAAGTMVSAAGASLTTQPRPVVQLFKASPIRLGPGGGSVTLVARVRNATTCSFGGSGSVSVRCKDGRADVRDQVGPNRTPRLRVIRLWLVARGGGGVSPRRLVVIREAAVVKHYRRPTPTTTRHAPAPITTQPPAPTTPPGPYKTFGDGTLPVGTSPGDIAPGTYQTAGLAGCYWARLSGLGGQLSDIIANGDPSGSAIVTIAPTDVAFDSEGCGTWSPLPATGTPATTFGDGTWAVGTKIAPGTYQAPGGTGCYWARLSDFSGQLSGIIANADPSGPTLVTIASSDAGFETSGCGQWTLVG